MPTTRAQLRDRAKRRADMVNSTFVADAEWNDWINEGLCELHDLLVLAYEGYGLTSADITLVDETEAYALPANFYKCKGADFVDGDTSYSLSEFEWAERNRYRYDPVLVDVAPTGAAYSYRIEGNNLRLIPRPGTGTVRLWFVPQPALLMTDASTTDIAVVVGWEELVSVSCAIKALIKEESAPNALFAQKAELVARIKAAASQRNIAAPKHVVDSRYGGTFGGGLRSRRF